jgi:hypothetical protein
MPSSGSLRARRCTTGGRPGAGREAQRPRRRRAGMCACRCGIRVHLRGRRCATSTATRTTRSTRADRAKGSAGIMKQLSPARLTRPLLRKAGSDRGAGAFEAISWERASRSSRRGWQDPCDRPAQVRALHRARPDAGADEPVRAPVRHAQLRSARRLLLGQHGRGDDLHDRRQLLGVRRPRPRAGEALRHDRHRRGPSPNPLKIAIGDF